MTSQGTNEYYSSANNTSTCAANETKIIVASMGSFYTLFILFLYRIYAMIDSHISETINQRYEAFSLWQQDSSEAYHSPLHSFKS